MQKAGDGCSRVSGLGPGPGDSQEAAPRSAGGTEVDVNKSGLRVALPHTARWGSRPTAWPPAAVCPEDRTSPPGPLGSSRLDM